ncbi:hypothetical protein E1262_07370 [Jiangella aurantiaca]|uniref:Uncharacterized protein n=1 Tax=Jiangella aurantiaca TaxID=2530373 RepID=A0A4R5AIY5_9ACTN|nr:hypothetical protein [Jiangella aurantiaca]TDD70944.1 hypothetical protein E1262_07370 [Jiangella aurantiaca]
MTPWELILTMIRRWPVVLAGALCTGALAFAMAAGDHVYWSRTEVVFLAPTSRLYPNALNAPSEDIIITAGVVAKMVTGPAATLKYASPDANLVGIGVRDGWSVKLPDTGGQWAPNFASQVLSVEVVAPDRETVVARQQELVDRIAQELENLQRNAGVDPVNDITVTVNPRTSTVYEVGGSRMRAMGMTGLLGGGATLAVIVLLEYRARVRGTPIPREFSATA